MKFTNIERGMRRLFTPESVIEEHPDKIRTDAIIKEKSKFLIVDKCIKLEYYIVNI